MFPFLIGFRYCELDQRIYKPGVKKSHCPKCGTPLREMSESERIEYARKTLGDLAGVIDACAKDDENALMLIGKVRERIAAVQDNALEELKNDPEAMGYLDIVGIEAGRYNNPLAQMGFHR